MKSKIWLLIIGIIVIGGIVGYFYNDKEEKLVKKIDKDKEYVYLAEEFEITDKGDSDTLEDAAWLKNGVFKIKQPVINIDKTNIHNINKKIEDNFVEFKNGIKYDNNLYEDGKRYLTYFVTQDYNYYINNNILSFVLKIQEFVIPSSFQSPGYTVYNIDLKTGELLTNDQLKGIILLSDEELTNEIIAYLVSYGIEKCDNNLEAEYCYDDIKIGDDTVMYLNDKNQLVVVVPIQTMLDIENKEVTIELENRF
jgi:hypothetical protein